MPPEVGVSILIAGLLMAVALPVYFLCRRRWVMAAWMTGGPIAGFALATLAASSVMPRLVGVAPPPANPNLGTGVAVLASGLATYAIGLCGAVAGSLVGAVIGHYRERAAGQCPTQRPRSQET